ncbi:MAG: tetratricopeptide repeat protein [Bacteroidaceae bacterium]|nr:tetratricopeptide repeat protein [Bacteroidaceae bacterium]
MITELINNPHLLDKQTLYELREIVAQYPYYQPARLLMLKNLYVLHDTSFDEELRRAAIYVADRRKLFELVEAKHYELKSDNQQQVADGQLSTVSRTSSLIDKFLDNIPEEQSQDQKQKPLPWYVTNDYMQLLSDGDDSLLPLVKDGQAEQSRHDSIIEGFLSQGGKVTLPEITAEEEKAIVDAIHLNSIHDEFIEPQKTKQTSKKRSENQLISEELAQKYIKQGNYLQAKEIITQLNLDNSEKNIYFADQIRFLDKLIRLTGAENQA